MRLKVIGDEKECTLVIPADKVIKGDVDLSDMGLTKLPDLSDVTVNGNFDCVGNRLTSLEGAPKSVGGDFYCGFNELITLKGASQSVGGYFDCSHNRLTSLVGAPQKVGTDFICDDERLKQEYQKMILERESQDKKSSIKFKNATAKLLVEKQQLSKPDSGYDI